VRIDHLVDPPHHRDDDAEPAHRRGVRLLDAAVRLHAQQLVAVGHQRRVEQQPRSPSVRSSRVKRRDLRARQQLVRGRERVGAALRVSDGERLVGEQQRLARAAHAHREDLERSRCL
jgi:hypothetical protein